MHKTTQTSITKRKKLVGILIINNILIRNLQIIVKPTTFKTNMPVTLSLNIIEIISHLWIYEI